MDARRFFAFVLLMGLAITTAHAAPLLREIPPVPADSSATIPVESALGRWGRSAGWDGAWSDLPETVQAANTAPPPEDIPVDWLRVVQEDIRHSEYNITWQNHIDLPDVSAAYHAPNRANDLRTYFTPAGIRVIRRTETAPSWEWGLRLAGYGFEGAVQAVGTAELWPEGNRIEYRRGGGYGDSPQLIEWYLNDEHGLQQNLALYPPVIPSWSPGYLVLELATSGNLVPHLIGDAVEFTSSTGSPVLRYAGLHAADANGRQLAVYLRTCPLASPQAAICILLDPTSATYPITLSGTVSGLPSAPDWSAGSDQLYGAFGYAVATVGDVNGDGYSDVVVGALYYDNGEPDEGAAFVFYGSESGPSTTPDWSAEADQSGANFAVSASTAGDVNGDGYADLIVGAGWYDVAGDVLAYTDAGRVYVYHGSAAGLSATADWIADCTQSGARFGEAVATAGDVNGDGYSDVIVGAYSYDNGEANEGAAFVYHGAAGGLQPTPAWTAESDQANASFGNGVSTAGDVNGDGYADVVVGADNYANGQNQEGSVYVYHGSAAGLSASADWRVEGEAVFARLGTSVSTAGDVNGDGYADVIIGAYGYDGGQGFGEGRAYVYHGSATGLSASADWTAESDQGGSYLGIAVGPAGDVNGDGYADVVVGAENYDNGQTDEGAAFLWYGSANGLGPNGTPANADWVGEGDQDGARYAARAVGTAGDVNGDGFSDLIVGAPGYDVVISATAALTDAGMAFVYYGAPAGLSAAAAWTAEGNQDTAYFGCAVATAGDVNGDGYADVIVGARLYDNGQVNEGRAYVYHGSAAGLSSSANWTAEGNQASASFGEAVGTAGDVNGDGYADVIVGAPNYDNDQEGEGRALVYYGSPAGLSTAADWIVESNSAETDFGTSVGTAGDVNGDGYADVIVGAPNYFWPGRQGAAFVYHGSAAGPSATPDWTAGSAQNLAGFGLAVGTAGDVNGDGYSDVLVGAHLYDGGQVDEGRAYAYYGSPAGLSTTADWTVESDQASANLGEAVGTAGDVNGDGFSDVLVGASLYDNGQTDEGKAYLYLGSAAGLGATPAWTTEGNQAYARYGNAVSTAGDVNGDGYADTVVGSWTYDNGQMDEGAAFVYHGSAAGLSTSADWIAESDQADAQFGAAVSTAGDVNGDGYADVVVGAQLFDNVQSWEGRTFLYYGNDGDGLDLLPRQMRTDGSAPVAPLGMSNAHNAIQLHLSGRMPLGREDVRLQWQVAPLGTPFTASGVVSGTTDWTDTLTSSVVISQNVTGLPPGRPHHWRVRLLYRPGNRLGQPAGRWIHVPWNGWTETDFRTLGPDVGIVKTVTPTIAAPGDPITYTLVFSNAGPGTALNVVISDIVPVSVTVSGVVSSGVAISNSGAVPPYVWNVADLSPGQGGVITITGVLSDPLAAGVFSNTARIAASGDGNPANDESSAGLEVHTCYATPDDGASVYSSMDAQALRNAVAAAPVGGTVKVAGTCAGVASQGGHNQVVYVDKDLVVRGGYTPHNWAASDPATHPTTLDALYLDRVAYVYGSSATLENLVLRNGYHVSGFDTGGGGGIFSDLATLIVSNTVVMNSTGRVGGGIFIYQGAVTLVDTQIVSNTANDGGGGVFVYQGGGSLTVSGDSAISYNDGGNNGVGGGIYCYQGDAILLGGEIAENSARFGGGVHVRYGDSSFTLAGGSVRGNSATRGAGIDANDGDVWILSGQVISNTTAGNGGGVLVGSPLSTMNMSGGTIQGNAAANGGGVFVAAGEVILSAGAILSNTATDGGGIYLDQGASMLTQAGGLIAGNVASGRGGGVYSWFGDATMVGGLISGNTAAAGGGVYVDRAEALFSQDGSGLIAFNSATGSGDYDGGGGLYVWLGAASLSSGQILSNTATDGGGAYNWSGGLWLDGSLIISNTASNDGGGLYAYSGSTLLNGGAVQGNHCGRYGGGVFIDYASVTQNDGQISRNNADSNGGGVYVRDSTAQFNQAGGTIAENTAAGGGGIYVEQGSVTLSSGQTVANTAGADGGGLFVQSGSAVVNGGGILGNSTSNDGGGAFILDGYLLLSSGQISDNAAGSQGGGVYVANETGRFTQTGGMVGDNWADLDGGGVGVGYGRAVLSGGQITDNDAGQYGGGLFLDPGTALLNGGQILSNTASSGGGVCLFGSARFTQTAGVVGMNAVTGNGGGFYVNLGTALLLDGQVSSNSAIQGGGIYVHLDGALWTQAGGAVAYNDADNGGGMYIFQGDAALNGGQVINNTALTNGGGVYVESGRATLGSAEIVANAAIWGGGVYVQGNSAAFAQTAGIVGGNSAANDGGGLFLLNGTATLSGGQVLSNTAGFGGGVYVDLNVAQFSLSGGEVVGNVAGTHGGGVYVNTGSATLSAGRVNGNSASVYGGGVYVGSPGNLEILGGEINGNTAGSYGGGVHIQSGSVTVHGGEIAGNSTGRGGGINLSDGSLVLDGGLIRGNSANDGGGLYVDQGSAIVSATQILSNTAANDGGGVYVMGSPAVFTQTGGAEIAFNGANLGGGLYVNGGAVFLVDGRIAENASSSSGGGMLVNGGTVTLSGGRIISNTGWSGAGAYLGTGTLQMLGGEIDGNSAIDAGGGVYVDQIGATLLLMSGSIHDNEANNGAGVSVNQGTMTMSGGEIDGNAANDSGGGIYGGSGSVTLLGGQVSGNQAGDDGGGLYLGGSEATLGANPFVDNVADRGGGVFVGSGNVTMNGTPLRTNSANLGGGLAIIGGTTTVFSSTIEDNGSGLYVGGSSGGSLLIENTVISGNLTVGLVYASGPVPVVVTLSGAPDKANVFLANGPAGLLNIDVTAPSDRPPVSALYNDWGGGALAGIEETLHHQLDDVALARVDYYTLTLVADPTVQVADGVSPVVLTATLGGLLELVPGDTISFTTSLGNLSAPAAPTDPNGQASVDLTSTVTGTARLSATTGVDASWVVPVTATVEFLNAAPVAQDDVYSATEDTLLIVPAPGVLANDSDPNNDPLFALTDTLPAHGTLTPTIPAGTGEMIAADTAQGVDSHSSPLAAWMGGFTYLAEANYCGQDSFSYHASDGVADSNVATVTIDIACVNDPPLAEDDAFSVDEDSAGHAFDVLANDSDPVEGDPLSITAVGTPDQGGVALTDGSVVTYTPAIDFCGSETFSYTVSDSNGGYDSAVVVVSVTNTNDPPDALDDAYTVAEDSVGNALDVLGNDTYLPDPPETLVISAVGTPSAGGSIINAGSHLTYTPAIDFYGSETFSYTVSDGNGGLGTAIVVVTVSNINDAPIAAADAYTTTTDATLVVPAPGVLGNDSDIEGDTLTAVLDSGPLSGTLRLNADGSFIYTPTIDWSGLITFSYYADDGIDPSNVAVVTIRILPAAVVEHTIYLPLVSKRY